MSGSVKETVVMGSQPGGKYSKNTIPRWLKKMERPFGVALELLPCALGPIGHNGWEVC